MKKLFVAIVLLSATPAAAWLAPQGEWNAAIATRYFNRAASCGDGLKCFRDAPWVVPKDYYAKCLAPIGSAK